MVSILLIIASTFGNILARADIEAQTINDNHCVSNATFKGQPIPPFCYDINRARCGTAGLEIGGKSYCFVNTDEGQKPYNDYMAIVHKSAHQIDPKYNGDDPKIDRKSVV